MVVHTKDTLDAAIAAKSLEKALGIVRKSHAEGVLQQSVDRLADTLSRVMGTRARPEVTDEVFCDLVVRGFVAVAQELPSTSVMRVNLCAMDPVRERFNEAQAAKVRTAVFVWADSQARNEQDEIETRYDTRFTVEEARELHNRWTTVAWGLTHGQRVDEPMKILGKLLCPNCACPVQHEPARAAEPDVGIPAWAGGYCCGCGWHAEDQALDGEDPEEFDEFTGPIVASLRAVRQDFDAAARNIQEATRNLMGGAS
jgi:hypothetical protein